MAFWQWSKTAVSNASADGTVSWPEGMSPSAVNDSARAMMARLAEYRNDQSGSLTTGGTSTAYTLTTNQGFDSLAHLDGCRLCFRVNAANGTPVTLAVDGLTAMPLRSAPSVELVTGALTSGSPFCVTYDNSAGEFYLIDYSPTSVADNSIDTAQLVDGAVTSNKIAGGAVDTAKLVDGSVTSAKLATTALSRGYIDGCILSNNSSDTTNDIDIAIGAVRDSTNIADITVSAMTKQLDANWVAGTHQGMRYSGAGIANGTYHIYAVGKADGTQDIYAYPGTAGTDPDTSASIATMLGVLQAEAGGSEYVLAHRLGSIVRVSGAIAAFLQIGDEFWLKTPILDVNAASIGTSAAAETLSVPKGVSVLAIVNASGSGGSVIYLRYPGLDDLAPSATAAPLGQSSAGVLSQIVVRTDTNGQITIRSSVGATSVYLALLGWIDRRAKDS